MNRQTKQITLRPSDGGHLVTTLSPENVGLANYVEKTNWRRLDDSEVRREGDTPFAPNGGLSVSSQSVLNTLGNLVRGAWEAVLPNGSRELVIATASTIYAYRYASGLVTIGTGFAAPGRWQGESLDGYLILNNAADLPVTYRVGATGVSPITDLRDNGVSCVGCIAVFEGFLHIADITEIQSFELAGVLNGVDPYGRVDASLCNRIRYKHAQSDYGNPRNWAPVIKGVIQSASRNVVTLDFNVSAFPTGTKVAVLNAGPNGGTLGGQTGYEDGVPVVDVTDNVLTLAASADPALLYPLTVYVTRWADTSTFSGYSSLQDDSSAIIAIKPLKRTLVIYRETGIWTGRYTGNVATPFVFSREYSGRNVPFYPHAIAEMEGAYHVFPAENTFYMFDGAGEPIVFRSLDACRNLFFDTLNQSNAWKAFAFHNPITRELWFCTAGGVLAYDYDSKTESFIDREYHAGVYTRRIDGTLSTGPAEYWVVLAGSNGASVGLLKYGALSTGAVTFTRWNLETSIAAAPAPRIRSGVGHFGNDMSEKDLTSYTLLLHGVSSDDNAVEVALRGSVRPVPTPPELFRLTLMEPATLPVVAMYYRETYYQDEIALVSVGDTPVTLSGRVFEVRGVQSRGSVRTNTGHA